MLATRPECSRTVVFMVIRFNAHKIRGKNETLRIDAGSNRPFTKDTLTTSSLHSVAMRIPRIRWDIGLVGGATFIGDS